MEQKKKTTQKNLKGFKHVSSHVGCSQENVWKIVIEHLMFKMEKLKTIIYSSLIYYLKVCHIQKY